MLLQAAGAIHTDFERGFICAEVMQYDALHELKTEADVKAAGKYKQEGKNYVVQVWPLSKQELQAGLSMLRTCRDCQQGQILIALVRLLCVAN